VDAAGNIGLGRTRTSPTEEMKTGNENGDETKTGTQGSETK
jgi:hypothetical protein